MSLHTYHRVTYVQLREGPLALTESVRRDGAMEEQLEALAASVGLSPSPFLTAWQTTAYTRKTYYPWWAALWGTDDDGYRKQYTIQV